MVYTICQIPVVLQVSDEESIIVHFTNGNSQHVAGHVLDLDNSTHILQRDGTLHHLIVSITPNKSSTEF
jgi:hypothetical protein